jgi:haloalkane dehalogenase
MTSAPIRVIRTPDANFDGLAEFPCQHYLSVDGLRMHYIDEGSADGPVALMVHGMPTWSYLYRHIIPVLVEAGTAASHRTTSGFGRSDKVTDPAWHDIARHTANLARLVRELDLHDITLVAQDWGGPNRPGPGRDHARALHPLGHHEHLAAS